jgi:hypothetical protein
MGEATLRVAAAAVVLGVVGALGACAAPLPEGCLEASDGDLEGYCVLGSHDGAEAAAADESSCAGLSDDAPERSVPDEVAEGPGDCGDEVSDEVLAAEQAAYVDCWQAAYDESYTPPEEVDCPG